MLVDHGLPLNLCGFQHFVSYLLWIFQNSAGRPYIEREDYVLSNGKDTIELHSAVSWDAFATPGATILMAAVVRAMASSSAAERCPRCGKKANNAHMINDTVQWCV